MRTRDFPSLSVEVGSMNELVAAGKRSYDLAAFVASLGDAPSTDDPKNT